jgi:hypothetical protein
MVVAVDGSVFEKYPRFQDKMKQVPTSCHPPHACLCHAHTLRAVLRATLFVHPPPTPPAVRRPTPTAPNRAPALMGALPGVVAQALRELLGSDMGVRFHQASDGSGIGAALAAAY